jgi:4-hydroxy-4-methyl-2-oxoglutarate aldolase
MFAIRPEQTCAKEKMFPSVLSNEQLRAFRDLDTCAVSNAIEIFEVRLRNTGFTHGIRCMFPEMPPVTGYAATAQMRSQDPPIDQRKMRDHTEWWKTILEIPEPRIVVLQDLDDPAGQGAFIGDVHAAILKSLGCVGVVTNGAVRELPQVREIGVHLFAGNVAVSHSYAHVFHFGSVVHVGGVEIRPGDLLHADRHGVLSVPPQIAARIPETAAQLREKEKALIARCREGGMTIEKLQEIVRGLR